MKHIIVALISLCILHTSLQAQNWLTTGNKGLTTSNFLGTTDSKDLVFKAKNIERGRLQNKTGNWRFGSTVNNLSIDSTGNLRFSGNATYRIGENKYALLCNDMPQEGLFMNDDLTRWEFRDDKAFPFFTINNSTYDIVTKGGLQVGNSATAAAGNIRFNAGIFQGFDGKSWKDFRLVTATQLLSDTGLQTVNDREQKQINDLQQEINELKAVIQSMQKSSAGYNACAASSSSNNSIADGVSLQQNTPNPFYQSTVIKYSLPARFSSARIIITNSSGNTVIQHNVSVQEQGLFTLNAGTLASGTYHYALVIDGNIVNTKTMMLNK